LISDIKGATLTASQTEQGAEDIIWTEEGRNNRRFEKLQNYSLHNMYSSSNIIRMIKSRRMRWAGHVA
jgi:hypothetical protein